MGIYKEMGIADGSGTTVVPGDNWPALTRTFASRTGNGYGRESVRLLAGVVTTAIRHEIGSPDADEVELRAMAAEFADYAIPPIGNDDRAEFDDAVRGNLRRAQWHDNFANGARV